MTTSTSRAVHRVLGVAAGGLQLQGPGVVPVVRGEAGTFELDAPGGRSCREWGTGSGRGGATAGARGVEVAARAGEAAGVPGRAEGRRCRVSAALRRSAPTHSPPARAAAGGVVKRGRRLGGAAACRAGLVDFEDYLRTSRVMSPFRPGSCFSKARSTSCAPKVDAFLKRQGKWRTELEKLRGRRRSDRRSAPPG